MNVPGCEQDRRTIGYGPALHDAYYQWLSVLMDLCLSYIYLFIYLSHFNGECRSS